MSSFNDNSCRRYGFIIVALSGNASSPTRYTGSPTLVPGRSLSSGTSNKFSFIARAKLHSLEKRIFLHYFETTLQHAGMTTYELYIVLYLWIFCFSGLGGEVKFLYSISNDTTCVLT